MSNYQRRMRCLGISKQRGSGDERDARLDLLDLDEIRQLKDMATGTTLWKRIETYLPDFTGLTTYNNTADQIVGLTLHCFILSSVVLTVVLVKGSISFLKFVCFVVLNVLVYRGDISEPITQENLNDATVFEFPGLKVIVVQNQLIRKKNYRTSVSSSQPQASRSSSSQDLTHIFSPSMI